MQFTNILINKNEKLISVINDYSKKNIQFHEPADEMPESMDTVNGLETAPGDNCSGFLAMVA